MATNVNVKNPIEVRDAGLKALNEALGADGARAFIDQYDGVGDFTIDRHNGPDVSFETFTEKMRQIEAGLSMA
jgi:hypothetical protein